VHDCLSSFFEVKMLGVVTDGSILKMLKNEIKQNFLDIKTIYRYFDFRIKLSTK